MNRAKVIIDYLLQRGMSLASIGAIIKRSRESVSRVYHGHADGSRMLPDLEALYDLTVASHETGTRQVSTYVPALPVYHQVEREPDYYEEGEYEEGDVSPNYEDEEEEEVYYSPQNRRIVDSQPAYHSRALPAGTRPGPQRREPQQYYIAPNPLVMLLGSIVIGMFKPAPKPALQIAGPAYYQQQESPVYVPTGDRTGHQLRLAQPANNRVSILGYTSRPEAPEAPNYGDLLSLVRR